jgi:hypothetical protein
VKSRRWHGECYGTNEPGDRDFHWNQEGSPPILAAEWEGLRRCTLQRQVQFDTDFSGVAGDAVSFLAPDRPPRVGVRGVQHRPLESGRLCGLGGTAGGEQLRICVLISQPKSTPIIQYGQPQCAYSSSRGVTTVASASIRTRSPAQSRWP